MKSDGYLHTMTQKNINKKEDNYDYIIYNRVH